MKRITVLLLTLVLLFSLSPAAFAGTEDTPAGTDSRQSLTFNPLQNDPITLAVWMFNRSADAALQALNDPAASDPPDAAPAGIQTTELTIDARVTLAVIISIANAIVGI